MIRRPGPVRAILWAVVALGLLIAGLRYVRGLGAVTNLSDRFPWGLWVGFDILSGVALAAGGFTLAALVHVFHAHRYHPLLRPAIVTGFLGYVLVIIALLVDLGRPYRIWHAIVMWNPRSVMFEVAWCVMLYTLVLSLEFGQVVLERLGLRRLLHLTQMALPPLVIAGVLLSTLHQSSLGSLFLIVPGKLHPIWYTPLLPLLFFVSAAAVGPAIVTLEASVAARAFRHTVDLPILQGLARGTMGALAVYLFLRVGDLAARGAWALVLGPSLEGLMARVEIGLGVVLPLALLALPAVRARAAGITAASALVVGGVVVNRLNVAVTGMLGAAGVRYVPSWMEVELTLAILAAGILAYLWIGEHLPVFERHTDAEEAPPAAAATSDAGLAAAAARASSRA